MFEPSAVSDRNVFIRKFLPISLVGIVVVVAVWLLTSLVFSPDADDDRPVAELADSTPMGAVELRVADLELMQAYYENALGLPVLESSKDQVTLGFDAPLIRLVTGTGGSSSSSVEEPGLYHSAILYPTESDLAKTLQQLATVAPMSYQGSADHLVSLAFYAVDPEGNGVELYVDRPADEWQWSDGEVVMGSEPLDPNAFITEHLGQGIERPADIVMGHVHLKVGDLQQAEEFYADLLGFAVTSRTDGALFYAAGGYHHHLATNIWQSDGADTRTNPTGLAALSITVDDASEVEAIMGRLAAANVEYLAQNDHLLVSDPWGNDVRIVSR